MTRPSIYATLLIGAGLAIAGAGYWVWEQLKEMFR